MEEIKMSRISKAVSKMNEDNILRKDEMKSLQILWEEIPIKSILLILG